MAFSSGEFIFGGLIIGILLCYKQSVQFSDLFNRACRSLSLHLPLSTPPLSNCHMEFHCLLWNLFTAPKADTSYGVNISPGTRRPERESKYQLKVNRLLMRYIIQFWYVY